MNDSMQQGVPANGSWAMSFLLSFRWSPWPQFRRANPRKKQRRPPSRSRRLMWTRRRRLGSAMAYDPVKRLDELTLRCRGIVILGAGKPIVLCAVDWIGIANEGHDQFRESLADAAGTTRDRVAVHTLHQHDAPGCDFTAERLIRDLGLKDFGRFEGGFHREVMQRAAKAIKGALASAQPATHYGWGVATVKEVASNRRILGPDGKVRAVRYTATKDPALRAEPEGVIDPEVSLLSFWNEDRPIAVLSYYACHPQSYYRTGVPSPDFPGIARFIRGQAVPEALHVHFNGAGGNIGAGKYNDGSKENRMVLAQRLADGMKQALAETKKQPLTGADVGWETVPVKLPAGAPFEAGGPDQGFENGARPRVCFEGGSTGLGRSLQGGARDRYRLSSRGAIPGACTCRASCSSSTSLPPRRCVRICRSPWRPTAITARPTSARPWPMPKGATKPVRGPATSRRKSSPF